MPDLPPTVISFSVPAAPNDPVVAHLRYDGLRLAYCPRNSLNQLDGSWRAYGVYILLGRDGSCGPHGYRAYVGQAQTLTARLSAHKSSKTKDWATHMLLVARPDTPAFAFNLAEIGWLEGRLHAMLDRAQHAHVDNKASTGNSGLDSAARAALEALARPIAAALRTLGYPTTTPEQAEEQTITRRTYTHHGVKVADLLEAGLLTAGTVLRPTTSMYEGDAAVTAEGNLVVDGQEHTSPSPAASQITDGPRNGWEFWGVASGDGTITSLKELRAQLGDPDPDSEDS